MRSCIKRMNYLTAVNILMLTILIILYSIYPTLVLIISIIFFELLLLPIMIKESVTILKIRSLGSEDGFEITNERQMDAIRNARTICDNNEEGYSNFVVVYFDVSRLITRPTLVRKEDLWFNGKSFPDVVSAEQLKEL